MANITIRQRLTLWFTAAVAVLLSITAVSLIVVHARLTEARLDAELQRLKGTIAVVLQHELSEGLPPEEAAESGLSEVSVDGRHFAILTTAGKVISKQWSLPSGPDFGAVDPHDRIWTVSGDVPFRVVSSGEPPVPPGFIILTAASSKEFRSDRGLIAGALALVIPMAIVIAAAGAWWLAGRALKPAAEMADQAARITGHSSGERLHASREDELGQLATAFNGLLDRLDAALDVRRRFLAEASHELRTPVSIAQTAADVALSRETRGEAEYRDSLTVVSDQMKRLGRMVSDMLALARTDVADWPLRPHDFYLDELVTEVGRAGRLLGSDRQVIVEAACPSDLQFRGDEGLLRQMLLNLVENAVRHTPAGGSVRLHASPMRSAVNLTIHDTGGGIPDCDRDRIFERHVKGDPAIDGDGLGLGLAIARRIARAHGGDLTLAETGPAGTTFNVTLPMIPAA
jgi:signal transduction histidine kinase